MRTTGLGVALILGLLGTAWAAHPPQQKITVTGKLVRIMAIGAESTGWAIELDSETVIGGKSLSSIQVSYRNTPELERLANKRVRAAGTLAYRHGVETGEQPILKVSYLKEAKNAASGAAFSLSGSEWSLEDLAGDGVIAEATLSFPEAGNVAGNASCNRFFGPAEITGNDIKLGPLATTRMACGEESMRNQEKKYLKALQGAERFEWKAPYLLIHCKGLEKPLRFRRMPSKPAAT